MTSNKGGGDMKKIFQEAKIEVLFFDSIDVITASTVIETEWDLWDIFNVTGND